MLVIYRALIF